MLNRIVFALVVVTSSVGSGGAALAASANYTCNLPQTCALFDDTSSGQGIRAEANTGYGIYSTSLSGTGLFGSSGSGNYLDPGFDAESTNESNYSDAAAVFGLQGDLAGTQPAFGALSYGSIYGLYGFAANPGNVRSNPGYGVFGQDNETTNIQSDDNVGVVGTSSYGTGVLATADGSPTLGVFGDAPIGLYAVAGPSHSVSPSYAIVAEGPDNAIDAENTSNNSSVQLAGSFDLIYGVGKTGSVIVSDAGNETLSGTLMTSKGTYDKSRGASGTIMTSYGQRSTAPSLEDTGEAQLVNGRAAVAIDAKLSDVTDHRVNYIVFLTPEGDSKGLYVMQKGSKGFVVREQQGGRSTLAFAYRIVTKPLDQDGERLAVSSTMHDPFPPSPTHAGTAVRPPFAPLDRLRQRLGPAGFANVVRAARMKLTAP
jgi:hypothetical protein